jgi:hypothetical protein
MACAGNQVAGARADHLALVVDRAEIAVTE